MLTAKQKRKTQFFKVLLWGILVVALYVGLYLGETPLIHWTAQGHWTFIGPIAIAFLVSFVHGHFTGEFWDVLGIKPKLSGGKK
ncbi:conserved hypothetical protein, membrane [Candidatus Thiomargarita nelsonii]|uniref:Uncharacterized protein n=1 Tax=Candidatus Thiomargarita nelsonii TaxID=1003181 RepID=A0A176S071_9GAMM|nr:conserved hypothetical protein, membrane [Candidatus Thiomargarita nelsonii]